MENIHTITINEKGTINANGKKNSGHTIPVIGFSLKGNTEVLKFSSIDDAAKYIGTSPAYLSKCILSEKRCKGYKFFHAKKVASHVDEMIEFINSNAKRNAKDAEDAAKWREQEDAKLAARLAEEKRLADIAKAEEEHRKAIEKAKAKVDRLTMEVERKYAMYNEALNKLQDAAFELKALEDNENATEMEAVA